MKSDYQKGDTVWLYVNGHQGEKSQGKILEVLHLNEHGYGWPHYLIEVQTSIDPLLEVRDVFTLAPTKDEPIGFWSNLKNNLIKEKFKDDSE